MMTWFAQPLTTLAFCWHLARRDGVAIGLTSHDQDLWIDGFLYRASPGMMPSAVVMGSGLDAATLDVSGGVSSSAISEPDLMAGRWDGARLRLFAVEWATTGAQRMALAEGELGEVTTVDGSFTAELRGIAAALDGPTVELTSPDCRADFGDKRCRVALAAHRHYARILSVQDELTVEIDLPGTEGDRFAHGHVRWLEGRNSGLLSRIARSTGAFLHLRESPPADVTPGMLVELQEGCPKIFAACRDRFGNALNFQGEPHLPGMDLLTRYPSA